MIDALAASAIVLIGVIGLAQTAVSTQKMRQLHKEKAAADLALSEQVRLIEATPFDQIVGQHDQRGFSVVEDGMMSALLAAQPGDRDGQAGSVTINVLRPLDQPGALLEVTVRLDWRGARGNQSLQRNLRISRVGGAS